MATVSSTFQKRPAYKYIRESDRLPSVDEARDANEPIARIKLFDPCGSWTWYIAGYDADSGQAWGLVEGFEKERGCFDMRELCALRGHLGLPIERDLYWSPRPLSQAHGS